MPDPLRECFVIMPIRREGTEEHTHFKALYEYTVKPVLEAAGYHVVRADEVTKAGAVNKDVVERLARADLVVADMTDLNPNVFWELGVRHALSGRGTLTMLDEKRTSDIPFDLTPYRVIKYAGELIGLGRLKDRLTAFAATLTTDDGVLDSPVHDWLPMLPARAVESTEHSSEGALRQQVAELKKQLRQYERIYGEHGSAMPESHEQLLDVVSQAMDDAASGSDDAGVRRRVADAVGKEDVSAMLMVVRQVLEHDPSYYAPELFIEIGAGASRLGVIRVAEAILEHAHSGHPHEKQLTERWLAALAHSHDSAQRERARRELERVIGIAVDGDGNVSALAGVSDDGIGKIGFLLDAYQRDGLHERAVRLTTALIAGHPENAKLLRNHARALENIGRSEEALASYRRAVLSPDIDESAAIWFGNELHNRERHVDAVEAYLIGCLMDPNDAAYFGHVAADLSWAVVELTKAHGRSARQLPAGISDASVVDVLVAALSCKVSQEDLRRLESAAERLDIDFASIINRIRNGDTSLTEGRTSIPMDRKERVALVHDLMNLFRSPLTSSVS